MTSEKLYTSEEVAALFGLKVSGLYQYHKRFNIGTLKKVRSGRGAPKGNIFYSESDIAFIRSKKEKPKEKEAKEPTEYEKFIASFPCRLLTAKELSAVMGINAARLTELLDIYAVIAPHKSGRTNGKNRKLLWKETDIPKMQEDLEAVTRSVGGRKRVSGMHYENSPERIAEIKAKYANGVPADEIEKWLGV